MDSHCHRDDFFYEGKIEEVFANVEHSSVTKMVTIGTPPKDWELYADFVPNHGLMSYMVGFHRLRAENEKELDQLPTFLGNKIKALGISEIELEYHRLGHEQQTKDEIIES
jgi:Tat protein secretion system quality control protein TatD with DNase activity